MGLGSFSGTYLSHIGDFFAHTCQPARDQMPQSPFVHLATRSVGLLTVVGRSTAAARGASDPTPPMTMAGMKLNTIVRLSR